MFQIAGGSVGLGLTTTIITEAARDGTFTDGLEAGFRLDAAIAFVGLLVASSSSGAEPQRRTS